MQELSNLLKNTELFAGLDDLGLNTVLSHGSTQEYGKGEYLLHPLEKLDRLGFVLEGDLRIMHIFPSGNYSLMSKVSKGLFVGIDLVCTRTQLSPYHVMASTPVSIFWIPVNIITQPGSFDEGTRLIMLKHLLEMISDENMKKEYRLAILSQKGLRDRIISYLTMQANRRQQTSFTIPLSREEMASFLCVNRSALSHELAVMQSEGLLSFENKKFTLHNWELNF